MPDTLPSNLQLPAIGYQVLSSSFDFDEETANEELVRLKVNHGCQVWRNNELDSSASSTAAGGPTRRDEFRANYVRNATRAIEMGMIPMLTLGHWNWGFGNATAQGGALTTAQRDALRTYFAETLADFGNNNTGHYSSVGLLTNVAVFAECSELGRGASSNTFVEALYNWLMADIEAIRAMCPVGVWGEALNGPEMTAGLRKYHDFGTNSAYDLSGSVINAKLLDATASGLFAGTAPAIIVPTDQATLDLYYEKYCDEVDDIWLTGAYAAATPVKRYATHWYEFDVASGRELKYGDSRVVGECNVQRRKAGATTLNQQYRVDLSGCTGNLLVTIGGHTATLGASQTPTQWDTAIEALASVGAGNALVVYYNSGRFAVDGSNDWPRTINFQGALAGLPVQMEWDASGITGDYEIYEHAVGGDDSRAKQFKRLMDRIDDEGYDVAIHHALVFSGATDYTSLGTGAGLFAWTRGDAATPGTCLHWHATTGRAIQDYVANVFIEDDQHDCITSWARRRNAQGFW